MDTNTYSYFIEKSDLNKNNKIDGGKEKRLFNNYMRQERKNKKLDAKNYYFETKADAKLEKQKAKTEEATAVKEGNIAAQQYAQMESVKQNNFSKFIPYVIGGVVIVFIVFIVLKKKR